MTYYPPKYGPPFAVGLDKTVEIIMRECRNDGLEEAARVSEQMDLSEPGQTLCLDIAAIIRSLKKTAQ